MTVEVRTKEELNNALQNKCDVIIAKGGFAKKLKPLTIIKKSNKKLDINEKMSSSALAGSLTGIAGISVAVAITLIITIGIVSTIAILKDYNIEIRDDGLRFSRD